MIKTLLLGALQGLTEFLPVSSSGHLVIAQHFLNVGGDVLFLDTLLHAGTLGAVFVFFSKDIFTWAKDARRIRQILLVTAITGVIGICFERFFESLFTSPRFVSVLLAINGCVLIGTKFLKEKNKPLTTQDSALMGAIQGIAVMPGISRSGSTISALLARGVSRQEAFRFSFIASIPAVLGALIIEGRGAERIPAQSALDLTAGIATAFIVGLLSLKILSGMIKNHRFHFFGYYCLAAGLLSLGATFLWRTP